ncbi:hypothetical protein TCDM_13882 [Trypanosoma cruzi Dm28c]|uniref:Uncharacterized protein n=1 Tax=Trypanosoma cruzi Dm28c TaxID=1416333 RepID=V5B9V2_TRYCR|nr:hypothetical protein TCDM_13882 [Trypanosoma cruzi Dm28c]
MPDLRLLRPCLTSMWRWTGRTHVHSSENCVPLPPPTLLMNTRTWRPSATACVLHQSDNSCTALQLEKDMLLESSLNLFGWAPKRTCLLSHATSLGQQSTAQTFLTPTTSPELLWAP